MSHTVDYTRVQPGDALITFSKVGVLSVAEDLRQSGKEPAIIYGALPYSTRRRQMEGFLGGEMEYIVSTDAIGMGLNLPIRRIIFMETEKFDGVERRALKPEEIKQIAGRPGAAACTRADTWARRTTWPLSAPGWRPWSRPYSTRSWAFRTWC